MLPEHVLEVIFDKFSDTRTTGFDATTKSTEMSEQIQGKGMDIEGFTSFLMSSDNMAFDDKQLYVCDDMKRPLCEYFISSSHNVGLSIVEESSS